MKNDDSASNDDTKKDKMCEKVGQMKTILHELSSSYPINDQIVLPPNEINVSNMDSYVGKPKYLKDRFVWNATILLQCYIPWYVQVCQLILISIM